MAARLDGPSSGPRDRQFSPRDAVDVLAKLARRRRFVQFMKFVLPALAVATMAVVVGWPRLTNREAMLPLSFSALESENAALVMSNPVIVGRIPTTSLTGLRPIVPCRIPMMTSW